MRARADGLVVSVASLADGLAVAGARVAAYTAAGHAVADGRTDAAGLFVARGLASAPAVVVVTSGDDLAWVDLDDHQVRPDAREAEGRAAPGPVDAWLRADRGLVRPGETVHVDAILRTPTGLAVAEGLPVVVTLRGPDGRVVRRVHRRTPASGLVDAALRVPEAARTGAYAVELSTSAGEADAAGAGRALARAAVRVEPFVPDRIEAKVLLPDAPPVLGEVVPVRVVVRLFDGAPAPGRSVRLRLEAVPVDLPAVEGFVSGDADDVPAVVAVDAGEAVTGADGVATLRVPFPAEGSGGAPMRVVVAAEVVDLSGRVVAARVSADARPGRPRLGLAPPRGADVVASLAVAPAVDGVATVTLERVVVRGAWTPARHGGVTWTSSEVVEALGTRTATFAAGRATVAFPDPGDGTFRLRARGDGFAPAGLRFGRVGGRCDAPTAAPDPARLSVAIAGPVAPRAPVLVDVTAPFAGRALVTLEGPDVLVAHVVDVEAGATRIEIPLPDVLGPSLHATVTLARGAADAGDGPPRLFAAAGAVVVREDRRVVVRADVPDVVLPEGPVEVRLATSVPADVRVHLVDAAVLARTRHPDADPAAHFGARRRLDTRGADAYAALLSGARYPTRASTGGDEGEADPLLARADAAVPVDVATVALARATVAVDGTATVRLDVPAFEGRLRLVVVAASRTGTGACAKDVVVRGPVGLFVHAPLAVAPGDVFDVGVEARGDGVVTEVALDGLERVEDGAPLRVRALDRVGVATATVTARDAAGHRVVRAARVAVRPAAPFEVAHVVRALAAGERVDGPLPGAYLPASRRARVTVGTGPSVAWLPALDRLRDYPYGCVEQTTSRAFPLLALSALARDAHPDGGDDDLVAVDAAIERLLSMQTGDGGLATWPGLDTSWPFGTVYGGHFLVEAKRLGRPVPSDRLEALLDRVEETLRAGHGGAYEAFLLALAGRPTGTWLEVLAERATTDEDRARLASAFVRRGDLAAARALLEPAAVPSADGGPAVRRDADALASLLAASSSAGAAAPATGRAPVALASGLRADAILLDALVDARPDDPRVLPLVARLTASLAHPRTTQEDATVLLALAHHEAKARGAAGPARGRLVAGGREVAFRGGATLDVDPDAPWTWSLEADGPVTVVVRVEGVPAVADPAPRSEGMTVARRLVGAEAGLVRGRTYRVELEGTAPAGATELLVSDVLPGGFEVVSTLPGEGTLAPTREEVRDDRVLFFRSAPLPGTTFRHVYLVRATTAGTFALPAPRAELLYDPAVFARGAAGTVVVAR
ncbi:MAG: MG2 domain-containing protein [Planctomycetota bacterium]